MQRIVKLSSVIQDCYCNCYMCQGEGHSRLKLTKLGVGLRGKITLRYKECGIKLCLIGS